MTFLEKIETARGLRLSIKRLKKRLRPSCIALFRKCYLKFVWQGIILEKERIHLDFKPPIETLVLEIYFKNNNFQIVNKHISEENVQYTLVPLPPKKN